MQPQSRDGIRVRHMLDASEKIIKFTHGKSRADLEADEELSLALARLIEIIGEAASKVTTETQNVHPEIEWRAIIGTRNILIHAYEAVNLDILWQIVKVDIPPLITKLQRALKE